MADTNHDRSYVRETHTTERGGGGVLAFIVGGLLVAVGVIAYFVYGGDIDTARPSTGGDISVTVDSDASGSAGGTAATDSDSDSAAAPADGGAAANADAEANVAPAD